MHISPQVTFFFLQDLSLGTVKQILGLQHNVVLKKVFSGKLVHGFCVGQYQIQWEVSYKECDFNPTHTIFSNKVMTSCSSNGFMLLLLCTSALLVLCYRFDHGSRQVKRELVDQVMEEGWMHHFASK